MMDNANSNESEVDVELLSDAELALKLRQMGASIGPITNSTRAVYQRKLQRWMKYGPNRSPTAESSADVMSDESLPEISSSYPQQLRSEKAYVNPRGQADDSFEHDHFDSRFGQGSISGFSTSDIRAEKRSSPTESTGVSRHLPIVSQEVSSEDQLLRNRFNGHNVTPRPSLHSYKEDIGKPTTSIDGIFRTVPSTYMNSPHRQQTDLSTPNKLGNSDKRSSTVMWMAIVGAVAALILIAIIWNMESAYSIPVVH